MIDPACIGPNVDRSKIAPDAEISGASYLTGRRTVVGPGAVVRDARLHDSVVEAGARVVDSILVPQGKPGTHRCDAAGRTIVSGAEQPRTGRGAYVGGSTLLNTSVDERTRIVDSWACDCRFGADSVVSSAKCTLTNAASHVTITGPTEVSEAYLGHHTTIDQRGYYEGIFSNKFLQLRYNSSAGCLEVRGTIDLPHVSRYGLNTVNSTNSGKLLPQPDGILRAISAYQGLWQDSLLSHEQVELGPCCWIAPWTKVVGQSAKPHPDDDALVNDKLTSYVMPFAMAGVGGDMTRGLVMPGELSTGLGPKHRRGAWVFTHAPGAVIKMVRRLFDALDPGRKNVADTIVVEAIRTAVEMTKAMAADKHVDLAVSIDHQCKSGWPHWIATTHALLQAHLKSGMWRFSEGRPLGWREEGGRWTHPRMGCLLAAAPDALENQVSEEELFACADPIPPASVALPSGTVAGSGGTPELDPSAQVAADAIIAPGCRIGPGTVIESGATVWNSVLRDCKIEGNARIIGASGAVYGILLAYACYWPDATVFIYFLFPVKIKYLMIAMILFVFLSTSTGSGHGISNLTHLSGLCLAYVWLAWRHGTWSWRRWRQL